MNSIIRKTEINLITIGTGVILFGLWTFVKFFLTSVFADINHLENSDLFSISAWIITIIELTIRCYIGFSARSEGRGKRKRILYLILTSFIILIYLPIIALEVLIIFVTPGYIFNMIITLIIDATSVIFLLELMIDSIRLRRLRKQSGSLSQAPGEALVPNQNGGQP